MGSCSSRSDKDDVKDVIKITKKESHEMDGSLEKRQIGALNKRLSVNYNKIPNKIHRQDTRFQQGMLQDDEIYGLVGLNNLGNTCFMNSGRYYLWNFSNLQRKYKHFIHLSIEVFQVYNERFAYYQRNKDSQCLSNVPPLCDYFLSKLHEKEINFESFLGSKGQITQQFAELMLDMWTTDNSYIRPQKFLRTIGNFGPQFADGSQQDSHEFLAFLMDILHEDLNRVKKKPYIEGKDYNGNKYEEYAKESWSEYLTRNRSIIVDLFQGQTKSTLKCLKCSTVSHKFETFMYLSVPIPDSTKSKKYSSKKNIQDDCETFTLQQCIQEFTKEEKLERGELWFCPKCKKHQESTKKIDLWKMPNILIIHLKRFEFNKNRRCKLSNLIDFPIKDFDISNLTGGKQRDIPIYDLFAVSNHGGTLSSGHYTSYAKNRIDQNWYLFNDTQVQPVDDLDERVKSNEAYVLFYSKTSVEEFYRQTLTAPESWPHFFSDEKISEENQNDDSKVNEDPNRNKRKRNTKQHTYKFTNEIQKRDSKIFLPGTNFTGSRTNLGVIDDSNNKNGSTNKLSNGRSQTNLNSGTKFEMMNSVVNEEDNFQGNLDDSFNHNNGDTKQQDRGNQKNIKNQSQKLQVSPSTVKMRNIQYFGNDQRTGGLNTIFSPPKDESKNKPTQSMNMARTDDLNIINIQSTQNKQYFQSNKFSQPQIIQNNSQTFGMNKQNTNFQYNIIKSTH